MRCRRAGRGRRGSVSITEGVRGGCGLYPLQARTAQQACHFLDTRGGGLGVRSLCVAGARQARHFLDQEQARTAQQACHFRDTRGGILLTGVTNGIGGTTATSIILACFTSAIITPDIM